MKLRPGMKDKSCGCYRIKNNKTSYFKKLFADFIYVNSKTMKDSR